ncbi:MAG: SpoIID/LytB domain-containing protein [Sedimentisphaerales bacterium]|nr:SpoIID/LytB domain-containing protein [Sedimentisphaerales bacterium]
MDGRVGGEEKHALPVTRRNTIWSYAILAWVTVMGILCLWIGCRRRQILEPTPGMDTAQEYQIRVLLFDNIRTCLLAVPGPVTIRSLTADAEARFPEVPEPMQINRLSGKITVGEHVFTGAVEIVPESPFVFSIDGQRFRGHCLIVPENDGDLFDVINRAPMEAYLAGVVGAEMPSYWEAAALAAQAVASRTYALYHKQRYGSQRAFDVRRTESNQVYRGVAAETPSVWRAVEDTRGLVLTCVQDDKPDHVFPAYFASTCGGHTESSGKVFGTDYPALQGVACPYCRETSRRTFYSWNPVRLEVKDVSQRLLAHYPSLSRLESVEQIEPLDISRYEDFQRITKVNLIGRNGKKQWLEAENLRLAIDPSGRVLKSTAFEIERSGDMFVFSNGRGFGHGVGLCQYGALGLARAGNNFEQILAFYYPDAKQVRLY